MDEEKLTKVIMEFETYTQVLEGEEAQNWLKDINSKILFLSATRNDNLKDHKWKRTENK